MQVFILQCFTRIAKNFKKRENTKNLCLIIRGSQVQALLGPRNNKAVTNFRSCFFHRILNLHGLWDSGDST